MATNEISNALHAGCVVRLSTTPANIRVFGGWGVRRVYLLQAVPSTWIVELEQPGEFDANDLRVSLIPMVSRFEQVSTVPEDIVAGIIPTNNPNVPEDQRGQVAFVYNSASQIPGDVIVNLQVMRIPTDG